tara:strand:+ start:8717 stop:8962 length:246 start_codon:yes stop_codon:yes gene_type:complete
MNISILNKITKMEKNIQILVETLKKDKLLTVHEMAKTLNIDYRTALNVIRNKKIKSSIVGNRYRVYNSDLLNYIKQEDEKR